jgi:light-regulated signal transduction histidine kinase (bacteriophytochrome)
VHDHAVKLLGGDGRPWRVFGISEDVTDRKSISEAISEMNAALAKKAADLAASNEELEAFAYSVSHDLRAPLRHVNGFINLLRDHIGGRLDPTSERYLGKIQAASVRMSALIDELLALSRTSRIEMTFAPIALGTMVGDIVQELANQHPERRIDWQVGALPTLRGDATLMRQALFNLLENAVKYTGNEAAPRIEVGARTGDDGETVLSVRDNGVGFEMKYAHKLFGVFQRLHRQEEFPGTGIGLAHVRRIVERHRGRVWAESTKGRGAVFYIALPDGSRQP